MTWFSASAIVALRYRQGQQAEFPVFENVYLVSASSFEEATDKARELALANIVEDETLTLNDQPARMELVGIRKIIEVCSPITEEADPSKPVHGAELTYSEYVVGSESDLASLAEGKSVPVLYAQ